MRPAATLPARRVRHRSSSASLPVVASLLVACGGTPAPPPPAATPASPPGATSAAPSTRPFDERAAELGLDFHHVNGMTGRYLYPEVFGPGVAWIDYDGDGDLDAYLVQGGPLGSSSERGPGDRLFRNDLATGAHGELVPRFTDVTAASRIAVAEYGMGAAVGDFDGDGFPDLYVTAFGPNHLLHNDGDGTFSDATAASGTGETRWSVAATFFDDDGDGRLDLYVGNYVRADLADPPLCRDLTGAQDWCDPSRFRPESDRLFRNLGHGRFADVSRSSGLAGVALPSLGAVAADFDGDGRLDLYVANDAKPNNLWINRGGGRFEDDALLAGCAVDAQGDPQASMGVDAGDFDGDGDLDLFMTHLSRESDTLYVNDGHGSFADRSAVTGLGAASLPFTSFGTAWIDYDDDGWLDLFVANGAVTKIRELAARGDPLPLHQTNQLFHDLGVRDGLPRFADVAPGAGPAFALSEVSRGAAFGDVDENGAIDILVGNNGGPVRLFVNRAASGAAWVGVRMLVGDPGRDAYGARAMLVTQSGRRLWRRVRPEGSYASANDPRMIFGLGAETTPVDLHAIWPDGSNEVWRDLPVGRYAVLHQRARR